MLFSDFDMIALEFLQILLVFRNGVSYFLVVPLWWFYFCGNDGEKKILSVASGQTIISFILKEMEFPFSQFWCSHSNTAHQASGVKVTKLSREEETEAKKQWKAQLELSSLSDSWHTYSFPTCTSSINM